MTAWPAAALDALPWPVDTKALARWAVDGLVDSIRVPGRGRTGLEHRYPLRAVRRGIALTALSRSPLRQTVDRWQMVDELERCPRPGLLVVTADGAWGGHPAGGWARSLDGLRIPIPSDTDLSAALAAATVTA